LMPHGNWDMYDIEEVCEPEKTPCTLAETTFTIDETIDGNSGAMSYFAVVNVPGPWYVFRQNPGTCSYKELHFGVNQNTRKVYVGMCGVGTSETVAALPDGVNAIAMKYHAYGELEIWANGAKLDLLHSQINGRAFSSSSIFQSSCSDQIKVYNRALSQNELETMTALTSETESPTVEPTTEPTREPSLSPTSEPSLKPSSSPTIEPTKCTVKYTRHRSMVRYGDNNWILKNDDLIPTGIDRFTQGAAIGIDRCKVACAARPKCKAIAMGHPTRGTAAECWLAGEVNDQDNPLMPHGNWDMYDIEEVCEPGAVLKECRWESNHDQNPNSADYMGWTCANDEILTGFGLSADQHDVTKVRCCKVGGHSSIKSNTCTYVESNHERAKCGNGNDHMVFSGAYDKRVAVNDAVTEILAGKCCEVECDAPWCAGGDWGVDKNNCQVISTASTQAQELVCPTGTIMTEVEDGLAGNAHGVQKVASVTCCALDMIAPPTRAPTAPPSTARPTSAPTTAPSTSLPSMAPTTVDDCLLALKDSSQLTDSQYLSNVDLCLPGCRSPRRALESRQLTGRLLSESNSV